jgi:isopenicillin N synthase-like dioxygenase
MSGINIPIIPIEAFRNGTSGAKDVSARVKDACETIGFFVITKHGLSPGIIEELMFEARLFFDRPLQNKIKIAPRGKNFGGPAYVPLRAESLAATLGHTGTVDLKECLDAGPRFQGDRWPSDCHQLERSWNAAFAAFSELAAILRALFADAMGMPHNILEDAFARHCSSMRTLNYPETSGSRDQREVRAGAHTDYGAFTILRGDDAPGLQVQGRNGVWIDVPIVFDSFVINIGDALMRWTNDCWLSTPHRVVTKSGTGRSKRRQSVAYFHNPSADAIIQCLPPFLSADGCALYPPISYRDYAEKKFQQSRGTDEDLIMTSR